MVQYEILLKCIISRTRERTAGRKMRNETVTVPLTLYPVLPHEHVQNTRSASLLIRFIMNATQLSTPKSLCDTSVQFIARKSSGDLRSWAKQLGSDHEYFKILSGTQNSFLEHHGAHKHVSRPCLRQVNDTKKVIYTENFPWV